MSDPRRALDDVIATSLAARERRVDPGAGSAVVAGVLAAARTRRRRRYALQSVAAVAAVGAVVGAGLLVGGGPPTQVPATPGPSTSPTTTVAPTPSPTPSADARAALVAAGAGLPAGTVPVTDDVWAQTGPGWVLAVVRPSLGLEVLRNSVVLASPQGRTYLVVELPLDVEVAVQHWEPGSDEALVTVVPGERAFVGERAWLDLRTGAVVADPAGLDTSSAEASTPTFLGIDHLGRELWVEHGVAGEFVTGVLVVLDEGATVYRLELGTAWGSALLDPNARMLLLAGDEDRSYRVVDLDAGDVETYAFGADQRCRVVGWTGAQRALATCVDDAELVGTDGYPMVWTRLADVVVGTPGATAVRELVPGDLLPEAWGGAWLAGHGTVAPASTVPAAGEDAHSSSPSTVAAFARDGAPTVLLGPVLGADTWAVTRAADGVAYAWEAGFSDAPWSVVAWDGGAPRTAMPGPAAVAGVRSGEPSWVVAGDQDGPR
ncbi:hypothetical protein [Cellulomonas composti]|uniref:Uncharacterized protein n=1 Tax=Cellulomonas composti TaxID=266130 RepID=A0A511JEH4_9CELL|nr:hypothetical protein [Cellulomonas composti]GEL96391.1 hypothetical protein CCO02nite_30490 [Cellulomonas composti]